MTVPTLWRRFLLLCWAGVAAAQLNVCKLIISSSKDVFSTFSPVVVTEEEHSPAMEEGLQSALSYLEKEKLADIKQNRISLRENQKLAKFKAHEAGRADQSI